MLLPVLRIENEVKERAKKNVCYLPCNVILFLSSEIVRNLLFICNAFANSLAPMSPMKLPHISVWNRKKNVKLNFI